MTENAPMSLVFSPMREADLAWVAACEQAIQAFPWTLNNFADSIAAGYSSWMVYRDGVAAGYLVLMLVLDEAHLLTIGIAAAEQGRGLGSLLLAYGKDVARSHGAQCMFLEVRPSNTRACALYQRRAFVEVGRRKAYYPTQDGREDAIVMRCEL